MKGTTRLAGSLIFGKEGRGAEAELGLALAGLALLMMGKANNE